MSQKKIIISLVGIGLVAGVVFWPNRKEGTDTDRINRVDEAVSEKAKRNLFPLDPNEIQQLAIAGMKDEYILRRDEDGNFTAGRIAENQSVNQAAVQQVLLILSTLPLESVYDSSETDDAIGLANPEMITAIMRDGFIYQLMIGANVSNANVRAVRINVSYRPDATPDKSQAVIAADRDFKPQPGVNDEDARQRNRSATYAEMMAAYTARQKSNTAEAKRIDDSFSTARYKVPSDIIDALMPMKRDLIQAVQ